MLPASMEWGNSPRSEIDRSLAACRYGIVVFSKAFQAVDVGGRPARVR
jgi:hypothetical protein